MILILEGVEASGKTTIARNLTSAVQGSVRYRALRASNEKWGENEENHWRSLGVPANTFIEDVYAMDCIDKMKPDKMIILDRSLISGIVYDEDRWAVGDLLWHGAKLLDWWSSKVKANGGFIAHLVGDLEYFYDELLAHDREIDMRTLKKHRNRTQTCLALCRANGVEVREYDTSSEPLSEVAYHISRDMGVGYQHNLFGNCR